MAKDKATEEYGVADDLRGQVAVYAGPSDGTIIRFDYTFDGRDGRDSEGKKVKRHYYTYVALWIESAGAWYLTGESGGLSRTYKHPDLMAILASEKTRSAEVAAGFEGFKP